MITELLQPLDIPNEKNIQFYVLRLDLIDSVIGGNKYFKLKYNFEYAKNNGYKQILSFGGAYSNHVAALAQMGYNTGIQTIAVVRGEELHKYSNSTLKKASENGMKLVFVSRTQYRDKYNPDFLGKLQEKYGDFLCIPEGGSNELALHGCREIVNYFPEKTDYVLLACGTAGTIAGISLGLNTQTELIGIPVLKNAYFLEDEINRLRQAYFNHFSKKHVIESFTQTNILHNYHFGGYAKQTAELEEFIRNFTQKYAIEIDPIYNAKSFYALFDLIKKNYFREHSTVVIIHTGGMQSFIENV